MSEHSIMNQVAFAYCPVIDRNRAVTATRLSIMPLQQGAVLDAVALLSAIGEVWPVGKGQVWLDIMSERLVQDIMQAQPPTHLVIEIPAFMATEAENNSAIRTVHANGSPLVLKGRPRQDLPRALLACFQYALIDLDDERRSARMGAGAEMPAEAMPRGIGLVQSGVRQVADMEESFRRGSLAVLGWPIDDVTQGSTSRNAEQPALQAIVQLIDQVHKEADIEVLENTLKRDPPLAYKLLRYINSPGFGLSIEIGSFRHAIMVLGYQRLKRWLALLLATASKDPNMRPVMYAAVRRGLLMEELGRSAGNDEMRNELFICGVFSLLDRMFKQPFAELLKTIPVPEQVFQALVDGTGPYEPYFRLVSAMENHDMEGVREASEGLFMSMGSVNEALFKALGQAAELD